MKHGKKLAVIIDILVKYVKVNGVPLEALNGNILKVQRLIVMTSVMKREAPYNYG